MCILSTVIDQQADDWRRRLDKYMPPHTYPIPMPNPNQITIYTQLTADEIAKVRELLALAGELPTREEIEEFRRVVEEARAQDAENGEPDCEMESKKKRVQEIADLFGVEIEFV